MIKVKVGCGFDAHKFADTRDEANFLMLGGVKVPHPYKLTAHSDGDLVLHALVDAMLGTVAGGDIGLHFPPSDPQWKGCDSSHFLKFANKMIKEKSGTINNVDITIICEAPRLSTYRSIIQQRIAELLEISAEDVNIKGTTTEKMGFTGRKEGIACQAVICVSFPTGT